MSEHKVTVSWKNNSDDFSYEKYSRDHLWQMQTGQAVKASAAPEYAGNPQLTNPEEALVAAASSCHMLTFLAITSKRGLKVKSYEDQAVGFLEKNEEGVMAVTRIELHPRIIFDGPSVDKEKLDMLHQSAHKYCFIANSIKSKVEVIV